MDELADAERLLSEEKHHILSKDYHDGAGRQYWLRDTNQDDIMVLTSDQVDRLLKRVPMKREHVISSDEAYILATKDGHEAWGK